MNYESIRASLPLRIIQFTLSTIVIVCIVLAKKEKTPTAIFVIGLLSLFSIIALISLTSEIRIYADKVEYRSFFVRKVLYNIKEINMPKMAQFILNIEIIGIGDDILAGFMFPSIKSEQKDKIDNMLKLLLSHHDLKKEDFSEFKNEFTYLATLTFLLIVASLILYIASYSAADNVSVFRLNKAQKINKKEGRSEFLDYMSEKKDFIPMDQLGILDLLKGRTCDSESEIKKIVEDIFAGLIADMCKTKINQAKRKALIKALHIPISDASKQMMTGYVDCISEASSSGCCDSIKKGYYESLMQNITKSGDFNKLCKILG